MVRWLVIADTITTYTTSALQGRDNVLPDQACVRAVTFLVTNLPRVFYHLGIWSKPDSKQFNRALNPTFHYAAGMHRFTFPGAELRLLIFP